MNKCRPHDMEDCPACVREERDDLLKANALLHAFLTTSEAKVERLRKGIQDYLDGNYENPRKHRPEPCKHNSLWYHGCEFCIDEHLQGVLDATPISQAQGGSEP